MLTLNCELGRSSWMYENFPHCVGSAVQGRDSRRRCGHFIRGSCEDKIEFDLPFSWWPHLQRETETFILKSFSTSISITPQILHGHNYVDLHALASEKCLKGWRHSDMQFIYNHLLICIHVSLSFKKLTLSLTFPPLFSMSQLSSFSYVRLTMHFQTIYDCTFQKQIEFHNFFFSYFYKDFTFAPVHFNIVYFFSPLYTRRKKWRNLKS